MYKNNTKQFFIVFDKTLLIVHTAQAANKRIISMMLSLKSSLQKT